MSNFQATAGEPSDIITYGKYQSRATQSEAPLDTSQQDIGTPFGMTEDCGGRNESASLIVRLTKRGQCSIHCHCVCHQQRVLKTPNFLHSMLGLLFVGYHGSARLFTTCDAGTCLGPSRTNCHVLYMFPRWVLDFAVFIKLRVQGPELLIRCLRVRQWSGTLSFQLFAQARYDQVGSLIANGQASVLDVSESGGSMLYVSPNLDFTILYCVMLRVNNLLCRLLSVILRVTPSRTPCLPLGKPALYDSYNIFYKKTVILFRKTILISKLRALATMMLNLQASNVGAHTLSYATCSS